MTYSKITLDIMTLEITAFGIVTHIKMTLSIMTLRITALSITIM